MAKEVLVTAVIRLRRADGDEGPDQTAEACRQAILDDLEGYVGQIDVQGDGNEATGYELEVFAAEISSGALAKLARQRIADLESVK